MTKDETALIKKAIFLIHNENEYFEGMNILANLVGIKPVEICSTTIDIREVFKQMDGYAIEAAKEG